MMMIQKVVIGLLCSCGLLSLMWATEPTIVVDPITKTIKVIDAAATGAVTGSGAVVESGAVATPDTHDDSDTVTTTGSVTPSPEPTSTVSETEFDRALAWMYEKGLTSYNTPATYFPQNDLTREQFAKMVNQFYIAMGYDTSTKNTACDFTDIGGADPTLIPHIKETCRLGIFKGYNGLFMPFRNITKAEVLAVLMRVYNQKKLDETKNPWWLDYYTQAKNLNIVQDSMSSMDANANREMIALYVWRLRQVIESEQRVSEKTITSPVSSGSNNLNNAIVSRSDALAIDHDAVLLEAIHSMYEDGMIGFDVLDDSKLYHLITRAEAARLLDAFGTLYVNNYTTAPVPEKCLFEDIATLPLTTQDSIKQLCAMNVMKGDAVSGNFFPSQVLTKAQFVTTVVRMIDGVQDEHMNPRWESYYQRALARKLITSEDRASFERDMAMVEVITFMHKLKIHALLGNAKNIADTLSNEFMRVIEDDSGAIKAYIDSNFLRDIDTKVGYILLDEHKRYKVIRDHIEEYNNARLAWYGTLYDPITDKNIGSLWFVTQKGHVIQGTIRLMDAGVFYTLSSDEQSYYRYTIQKFTR